MKVIAKRLLSFLVVATMVLAMVPTTGIPAVQAAALQLDSDGKGLCSVCNETVQWTEFDGTRQFASLTGHQHFYLAKDVTYQNNISVNMVTLADGAKVCFNLNGHTLTSGGRMQTSYDNNVLNVIANGGSAVFDDSYSNGCNLIQQSKGVVNVYGGTYSYTGTAGREIFAISRTFALTDVTVNTGLLLDGWYSNLVLGGATTVAGTIVLNDERESTTCKITIAEGWRGSATVSATANMLESDGGFKAENGTATGDFTGRLTLSTGGRLINENGRLVCGVVMTVGDSVEKHTSVADAVAAYTEADFAAGNYIQLPYAETVALQGGSYYIDCAGFDVEVTGTGKLYPMDSSNDDFEGAAQWTVAEGVEIVHDHESARKGTRYVVLTENGITSAHALVMELSDVSINVDQAGLYYNAQYQCDDVLAEKIDAYGIIASVKDMPGAEMSASDQRTKLYTFAPDDDHKVVSESSTVYGIFKDGRTPEKNAQNGRTRIYANAYIELDANGDGQTEILVADNENVGKTAGNAWSLYDVLKHIEDNWASFTQQHGTVKEFYLRWAEKGMDRYGFTNIADKELELDASGNGLCPVCNKTVQWTEFDGTVNYTNITTQKHFYLAKNVTYTYSNSNLMTIAAKGNVCFHLNGYTLQNNGGRFWLTAETATLNFYTESGGVVYNVSSSVPGFVQQNNGNLNVYGGTYTPADGQAKPFISAAKNVTLQDATIGGYIVLANANGNLTLKGATTVDEGIDFTAGKLTVDTGWTGSTYLNVAGSLMEKGAILAENGVATGDFTGNLTLASGEKLKNCNGLLATDAYVPVVEELQLDANGNGLCPVCNKTVAWTKYTGTNPGTLSEGHTHYYLADDVTHDGGSSNTIATSGTGKICFHLNGYTLTTAGGIGAMGGTINLVTEKGQLVFTGTNSNVAAAIWNSNDGVVNIYGGTYTSQAAAKPVVLAARTINATDATINGFVLLDSWASKFTLKGATAVTGGIELVACTGMSNQLIVDAGWTGSAVVTFAEDMIENGQVLAANGVANGRFEGQLTLSSGEELVYLDGKLAIKGNELMLDANGNGLCPVCNTNVTWTKFDGTTNYTGITTHQHFYLANNVTYDRDAVSVNMIAINDGGTVCFHLNGYTLTTGGRFTLGTEYSTLNLITDLGGIVYTVRNDVPGCIQQNMGRLNVYGGTYTAAEGETKPFIYSHRPVLLQDATINGSVNVPSVHSTITLKGETLITDGIVYSDLGKIAVDKSFTGDVQLTLVDGMWENNALKADYGTATGTFPGTLSLSSGEKLIYYKGLLRNYDAITTDVADPLQWTDIDALPIATNDMTEAQLRQLCIDFMKMQVSFAWTASHDVDFITVAGRDASLSNGTVYGGIPYITGAMGNIYSAMEYYNTETGMMDLSGGEATLRQFANQCSGATFWAWNRVCNSATYTNTADMTDVNGCIPVGDYAYPTGVENFLDANTSTREICDNTGSQKMYKAYEKLEPGDGVVTVTSANNHVMMVTSVYVKWNWLHTGIVAADSYITYLDQDGVFYDDTQSDGTPYKRIGGCEAKITFQQLFAQGYIPFTFAELNKQTPVVQSQTVMDYSGTTVTVKQLLAANVSSNYSMSDVTFVVKDENGNQVFRKMTPVHNYIGIQLHNHAIAKTITAADLEKFADGKHTIEVSVRIGTGEKPVVYSGTLVR